MAVVHNSGLKPWPTAFCLLSSFAHGFLGRMIVVLMTLFAFLWGDITPTRAAEVRFSPAFKTIGVWDKEKKIRADVNVWYPCKSRPSRASYGDWRLTVVRFGRAVEGRFPLILLSHDSAASRFSYHETAAFLASLGFVVMAPDHKTDNLQRMEHNFHWQQLAERMQELRVALDMAANHKEVQPMVDMQRVGIMGFGTGATTALLLGGATLDSAGWVNYCVQVPQSTTYCNAWAQGHVESMLQDLPKFTQSFADARIKSVVAVSPKYDFLITRQAVQSLQVPLLLLETEKDLAKKIWNAHSIPTIFPPQTRFLSMEGIDTRDLMAACPPALRKDLPDLCGTASGEVRKKAHESFNTAVVQFFLEQLGHMP